jgi:hypothetical protein
MFYITHPWGAGRREVSPNGLVMMDADKIRKMSDVELEFFLLGVEECERILREQIDNLRTELMDVTWELEELKDDVKVRKM